MDLWLRPVFFPLFLLHCSLPVFFLRFLPFQLPQVGFFLAGGHNQRHVLVFFFPVMDGRPEIGPPLRVSHLHPFREIELAHGYFLVQYIIRFGKGAVFFGRDGGGFLPESVEDIAVDAEHALADARFHCGAFRLVLFEIPDDGGDGGVR